MRKIDRFDKYMKIKGLNDNKVTVDLNLSVGTLSKSRKENRDLSDKSIEKILNYYCDLNKIWLLTGEGSMLIDEDSNNTSISADTRPRLPITVRGGLPNGFGDSIILKDCEMQPVIKTLPAYDFTMIVTGDSMEPNFVGGDEIAIRRVNDIIEWGGVYVLDTRDGAIIKRLYDAGTQYRCVSYNKDYQDFLVDKTSVFGVYKVVGLIRI